MKKLLALITILLLYATITNGQSKTPAKVDTTKKADSLKISSSTNRTEKFRKNDSAFKKLNFIRTGNVNLIDSLDLTLKSCSFEPQANAMVLQDLGLFAFNGNRIGMTRYKRIKIFNDNGKAEANIRI